MAYLRPSTPGEDGPMQGPFPCHAGEFCGNYDSDPVRGKADRAGDLDRDEDVRVRKRFGKGHTCKAYPTEADLAKYGIVGLYLRNDSIARSEGYELIPTPPELMEPGRGAEYNQGGKFGLPEETMTINSPERGPKFAAR